MPISRTTQGLIVFDEFDEIGGWWFRSHLSEFPYGDGFGSYIVDTSDKHSGAASLRGTWPYSYYMPNKYAIMGFRKYLDVGTGAGRVVRVWHKLAGGYLLRSSYGVLFADGYYSWTPVTDCHSSPAESGNHAWQKEGFTIPTAVTGSQYVVVGYLSDNTMAVPYTYVDRLVIAKGTTVTVTGLTPGQKIKIYRSSDDTLIDTQTCAAAPATSVALNVNAEDFPEQMYLKVYGTDGATLIETTTSYEMCGGDAWEWDPGTGTLKLTSDVVIVYRSAATGTPKTANLTANLKTTGGLNYPGASIQFTTVLGTMTPASDTTDANGNAESALTGTFHGVAIVKAAWLGDATVPACSDYCVVHIFYEAEVGDTDKEYQFFLEGIEYAFVQGAYAWNEQGKRETFEVELPEYVSTITRGGLVSIYRRGVKDFAGVLKGRERSLSDAPRVILRGADVSVLLDRCVELELYASKTPQFIIADLLSKYPCGILAGSLGACAAELTITIDTESLSDAIPRICKAVNWNFRVTLGRTLDFAETFTGGIVPVAFEEGVKRVENSLILDAKWSEDDYSLANWIRMKGDGITSTKQDGAAIAAQGLHQAPAFQKTISDQATLDTMCQALLDLLKTTDETIRVEADDDYDVGAFATEDQVTVTSETLDLAGAYTIKRIERDMTQPRVVIMDLSNRPKEFWDLDAEYRRMTKDVNV
jgi:hypothetical protein